jgi:putative FmdB family regulatory protein
MLFMPLYEYKCTSCNHVFEIQQKISEEPLKYCPQCKGLIRRVISAAGIIFKGSGFHVTDYRPKTEDQRPKAEKKEAKPTETKSSAKDASPKKLK